MRKSPRHLDEKDGKAVGRDRGMITLLLRRGMPFGAGRTSMHLPVGVVPDRSGRCCREQIDRSEVQVASGRGRDDC